MCRVTRLCGGALRRAKKAVEVDPVLLDEADKLKVDLEEEKKEKERLAKLEEERVEREAATEELQAAITAAKGSRDAASLSKPIKRAKKVWRGAPARTSARLIDPRTKLRAPASRTLSASRTTRPGRPSTWPSL